MSSFVQNKKNIGEKTDWWCSFFMFFFRYVMIHWYVAEYSEEITWLKKVLTKIYCWSSIRFFFLLLWAIIDGNILWVWWYAFILCLSVCVHTNRKLSKNLRTHLTWKHTNALKLPFDIDGGKILSIYWKCVSKS